MSRQQYVITVHPEADPESVATQLRSHGLKVDQVMHEIRIISASSDSVDVNSVRKLKGVSGVEESTHYQIPPPDSPVQ
jgi:KaiC/GvpD/RAD55 family RecA-like ATPase